MGTMLYARGVFINRSYDELNVSQPELVRAVHMEYLQSGAQIIETNTFGANRFRLEHYGFVDRVREINLAGMALARESVNQIREKQASQAFVAGAIGSLGLKLAPQGTVTRQQAREAFRDQVKALAEGGPGVGADLFILETMMSMAEVEEAIAAVKEGAPGLKMIVMITVDEAGNSLDGTPAEQAATLMESWGADAIGCSTAPPAPRSSSPSSNACAPSPGSRWPPCPTPESPREVDGRQIYMSSPEFMAGFARKVVKAGATFVGGCCGTTPAHIRAMKHSLRALDAMDRGGRPRRGGPDARRVQDQPTRPQGPLEDRRHDRRPRLDHHGRDRPPPRASTAPRNSKAPRQLYRLGVDAINVPDSPRASARMSAQSLCVQIQQQVGIETILHYTCRDRNVLSIQSDLIGASSIGLKNILCLTGDPPKMGTYPDATAVFDVDAIGLVKHRPRA